MAEIDQTEFPHQINLVLPLPSVRLARIVASTIDTDPELSPLVRRQLTVSSLNEDEPAGQGQIVIKYSATTARMLRVSTNGCLASVRLILAAMAELDEDADIDSTTTTAITNPIHPSIAFEPADQLGHGRSGGWNRVQGLDTGVDAELAFDRTLLDKR